MRKEEDYEMIDLDSDGYQSEGEGYYDENGEYYEEGYYDENGEYYEDEYYEEEYYEPEEEVRPRKKRKSGGRSRSKQYDYDRLDNRSGKKKVKVFWPLYAIFVSLMILGWLFVIIYCKKCLVKYEASQPENVIANIAENLSNGQLDDMSFEGGSRFESDSILKDTYFNTLSGQEITFEKAAGSSGTRPIFNLYSGNKSIGTVTLKATSSESMMLLLTAQTWEIESVTPNYETGDTGVTVKAPSDYTVYINGIACDDRELVDASAEIEDFVNVAPYTEVPTMAEYRIDGLMFAPEVKVLDASGNEAALEEDGSTYTASFASTDIPADLEARVLKFAEDYTNFFSGDLPGCFTSIDCLRPMFTSDSYFFGPAEIYRREDMGFYSAHTEPVFANEKVSGYTPVTDNFFYVDVYFEKNLHLTRTGEDRVDITNTRYYYVLENGDWVIADMKQNLE